MAIETIKAAIDKSQNSQQVVRIELDCRSAESLETLCNSIDSECDFQPLGFGRFDVRGCLSEQYSIRVRLNGLGSPGVHPANG